jgi:hypothetical protein
MLLIEFQNPETNVWDSPMWWVKDRQAGYELAKNIGDGKKFRFVEVEVLRVFDP